MNMSYILKISRRICNDNIIGIRSIFVIANMIITAATGAAAWLIVDWFANLPVISLICAMGYPAVFIGFIGSIFYLMNRDVW